MSNSIAELTEVSEISCFPTELGWFGFALTDDVILAVTIGDTSERAARRRLNDRLGDRSTGGADRPERSALATKLRRELCRFASGEQVDFSTYQIANGGLTQFQQSVQNVVRQIPYGRTLSYAEVAKQAGSPRAARAVGNVMAGNRTPLVIPCHRVVRSDGGLGGYRWGIERKRRLLSLEGVRAAA